MGRMQGPDRGRPATIPSNLYLIATMNPEDRSVDEMDAAMDRRWARVSLTPDVRKVSDFLRENGFEREARGRIVDFFRSLQQHAAIGHAYFRHTSSLDALRRLWVNQVRHIVLKQNRYTPEVLTKLDEQFSALVTQLEAIAEGGPADGQQGDAGASDEHETSPAEPAPVPEGSVE